MATMIGSKLVILDPTHEGGGSQSRMAPRPTDVSHKVVGLLDNEKPHSRELLDFVEIELRDRLSPAKVLRFRKDDSTRPAPEPLLNEIAAECELVINGVGD
jgi:hypothetical protein